jgi:beta-mannosidase
MLHSIEIGNMKKYALSVLITIMTLANGMAQKQLNWEVFNPLKNVWIDFGAQGSVQEAFYNAGELPDPFFEKNEELYQWMENYDWTLRASFEADGIMLKTGELDLNFHNIDTYAEIFLNDQLLGKTDNAFHPYSYNIVQQVKEGTNVITIVFTSPVNFHKEAYNKAKTKLPAPNDDNKVAIAPYTRKPQYQFGWDWSLRMNTMGFWKPVTLDWYSESGIKNHSVQTVNIDNNQAELILKMGLKRPVFMDLTWTSELFGDQVVKYGDTIVSRTVKIDNPRLWWPKGQGDQEIYEDVWTLLDVGGAVMDTRKVKFGIRTSELVREKDEIGTSYEIKVNGRAIFCKGGDYIPQDIFPSRVKDDQITSMVQDMAEANFNMVRVWGGGYYPDEIFYETCDELGLMVWQDFMFACAMYPGDEAFLANVKKEFDYQIPRISSHPSVVLFNGNNEVDVAWKNWGFQARYVIVGKEAQKIEDDYKRLFQALLPERISYLSTVPYIHTSPLSNWGKDEFYNHGSQHYWGVWHGKDPIEDFGRKSGRFNAEYGFQSFPQMSTINTFATKKDWDLESDIMKHHQKSYVGNGMMLKHAKILYGQPKTFEDFVYYSLVTQAKAVGIAIGAHRATAPRCMGTLYWQVNDCWAAPSWSSIDYFGNWKPLHYQAQRDYAEIAVVAKIDELNKEKYFIVSTNPGKTNVLVKATMYDLNGTFLEEIIEEKIVEMNNSIEILQIINNQVFDSNNFALKINLFVDGKLIQNRTFSHLPNKRETAKCEVVEHSIVIDENGKKMIMVETKEYLSNVFITARKNGVKIENNFIDLLPGKYFFNFSSKSLLNKEDILLNWM